MRKLPLFALLVALALVSKCQAGLTPPEGSDDFERQDYSRSPVGESPEDVQGEDENVKEKKDAGAEECNTKNGDCKGCMGLQHCLFAVFSNSAGRCVEKDTEVSTLASLVEGASLKGTFTTVEQCTEGDINIAADDDKNKTTTTASTTTASSTTTTAATSSTTTKQNSTTASTTPSTTSTSAKPTTASTATPTGAPTTVNPDARGGSNFDGWSFFGGILLTVGVSAIGFISFKYYKVRNGGSPGGTNYNRF